MNQMPLLFLGHGSPMNAIENNQFTKNWKDIANKIEKPKAILSISAHWFINETKILNSENPRTIYDMYGFPEELYKIKYNSKGSPEFAIETKKLIQSATEFDDKWGYDHGTWSLLHIMYPKADIPVYQLSVNKLLSPLEHFNIGTQLKELRKKGILIMGSGNIVHNLSKVNFNKQNGYDWAYKFDNYIKEEVIQRNFNEILNYKSHEFANFAVPSPDHFYPLLYILGASEKDDNIEIFNDECVLGSLSMTSYLIG